LKASGYLLPVIVYKRLRSTKTSVHNRVVRALELRGLVAADDLALPDHPSLISDVDVEADVVVDKAMNVSDQICRFTI
jgi:hypothetical protein